MTAVAVEKPWLTPPCCNPSHLREGTKLENKEDSILRGRSVLPPPKPGSSNPGAKLKDWEVEAIRWLRAGGVKLRPIAETFGVSEALVSMVARGKVRV